jgi:glycosyltransferase involved in cell wall biosynthesis
MTADMTRTFGTNAPGRLSEAADRSSWQQLPMVTVGLPLFDGKRWIGQAVEAILAQSFGDFELLISDNCSTDGSYEICESYARKDSRIRLLRNRRNVGVTENFNITCRMAAGRYFKYASCNDLCAPDFLLRCVEVLEAHPDVVVCHPRTRRMMEDTGECEDYTPTLHLMSDNPLERMITYLESVGLNNAIQGLIRLDVLRRIPLLEQYFGSDINLMAELSLYGKFYQVPDFLFYRRVGRQTLSAMRTPEEVANLLVPGKTRLYWQDWKSMVAFSMIGFRAPLGFRDRLKLWRYVGRRWRFARHGLFAEIGEAMKTVSGKS